MAKQDKQPSVKDQLATVERLIAREEAGLLKENDPFGLVEQRAEDQIIQEGEESDLRQALSRPEIRRVFYRVFKLGGLMEADSDPNPTIMAHHTGRRSLALDLYNAIRKVDGAAYYQMEREHDSNAKSAKSKEKTSAE